MGCFKLAFLFGGFSCLPTFLSTTSSLISLDFWSFLLSLPGESEVLRTCKEMIITQHCSDVRGFWIYSISYTHQPAEFQREVMCVVCLFIGLFLSYSSLKFDGTPLFSIHPRFPLFQVSNQGWLQNRGSRQVCLLAREDGPTAGAIACTCTEAKPAGAGSSPALC